MLATERGALSLGGAPAGSTRADPDGNLGGNLGDLAGNLGGDLGNLGGDLGSISAASSKLGSLDGEIDVLLAGGALEIQAGEQLRRLGQLLRRTAQTLILTLALALNLTLTLTRLRVVDASADSAGVIELHMPTKVRG